MSISVIIPVFNEEKNIETLYARLLKVFEGLNVNNFEILYVNDGSTDRGLEVIKQLARKDAHVRYLDLSRNFGHQIAVTAGLDRCTGERILIIDADLQDPPELIPELLNRMDEGYDVVYAKRSVRKGESFLKKITAKVFYRMLNSITNVHIPLDTGDFRVISTGER